MSIVHSWLQAGAITRGWLRIKPLAAGFQMILTSWPGMVVAKATMGRHNGAAVNQESQLLRPRYPGIFISCCNYWYFCMMQNSHRAVLGFHCVGHVHQERQVLGPAGCSCSVHSKAPQESFSKGPYRAVLELHCVGQVHQECQLLRGWPPGRVRQHRRHRRPRGGVLPQHRCHQIGGLWSCCCQALQREAALK